MLAQMAARCDGDATDPIGEASARAQDMARYYAFRPDGATGILHATISGFWTLDMIPGYERALAAAIAELGRAPGEYLLCCDVSFAAIQLKEVVSAFQAVMVDPALRARRAAMFSTQVLPRLQSRRVANMHDALGMFDGEAEALTWLKSAG